MANGVVEPFDGYAHLLGGCPECSIAIWRVFDIADALIREIQQTDKRCHSAPLLSSG
jgi:hypothetical protein